jgi:pimeloyl-ACP methyl ester carboxylesterase
MRYLWAGKGTGKPILLLHGLGVQSDIWRPNIPALVDANYDVIAIDLPGFGDTDTPSTIYTIEYVTSIINEFTEQMKIEAITLVGHSMGGAIAMGYAQNYSEKVNALILIDAYGLSNQFIPISVSLVSKLGIPYLYYRLTGQKEKALAKILSANLQNPERLPTELHQLATSGEWLQGTSGSARSVLGLAFSLGLPHQRKRFREGLRKIFIQKQIPVMVAWGEEDRLFSVSDAFHFGEELPESSVHIFENCGHIPPLEQDTSFNQVMLRFLGNTVL